MADRVMFITGASGGIGSAVARQASAAGWRTVLIGRRRDCLDALAAELGGPTRALSIVADVTEWDQVEHAAATARETFGQIDGVMANAGFGAKSGFLAESPEQWKSMILTNVYGAALTIRATFDDLRAAKGHLILTGSVAGTVHIAGSIYSATKWAISAMAESARLELHGSGARVTLIAPGYADTAFWDEPPNWDVLTADDVANAVMYALSQPANVALNQIVMRPTDQKV